MRGIIYKQIPIAEAGEGWQIGKDGRRFRKVGNTIEYEMEFSFPRVINKKDGETKKPENENFTGRKCPFKKGYTLDCFTDCALYGKGNCSFSLSEKAPETKGKACPISGRKCKEDCALYSEGCELVKNIKGGNRRKGQ